MTSEEIKKLIADAYMHGVQHGNNGVIPANSDLQEEADDYLCRSEIVSALHSVEAEKEPVTQEMIKAGLDAIGPCMGSCGEASPPDGEDVEACYLAMKELDQATTGMQAEKEPVNLPPAKPDLDPVEAHKRGEFVSDVEVAYNEGWNDCRHSAMYQTEKEPEWISCKDRLPTEDDGDCCQKIWAFRREDGHACHDFVTWVARMPHLFSHWAPTGLRRPAPPEHKPE